MSKFDSSCKPAVNSNDNLFYAGQLKKYLPAWEAITSDPIILDAIKHYHIEFISQVPMQVHEPRQINCSTTEREIIRQEISKLLLKGVIEIAHNPDSGFVSNVFATPKKDGSYRMILNLQQLNEFVVYQHFKMDNIQTALRLVRPQCFMASVDLKDAYYSVPIALEHRHFLMFKWEGQYYQYTCLPNGLACAPRLFTKILKPIYSYLHSIGHISMGHIDDSFLVGYTHSACQQNVNDTVDAFTKLGFVVHPLKEILGFVINSIDMTIRLPISKAEHVKSSCMSLFGASVFTIRELAHVIGLLVSSFPGVQFGRLHYRHLELDKVEALKISKGNYDAKAMLSQESYTELKWWIDNIMSAFCPIRYKHPDLTLTTDASTRSWGAVTSDNRTGGLWNLQEQQHHINYLELKAVLLGLQSLCSDVLNKHIRILSDNTTTVAYINAMGGIRSNKCNEIASEIWAWCSARQNVWISAAHIPGSVNVDADKESRNALESTEWSLNNTIFNSIAKLWGPYQIDLFASRLNFKVSNYR